MAARLAAKMGYTNVRVFHAGAPAWQKAGNPLVTTYGFVSERLENVVLIDTRGPAAARQGHIQGAFAVALDEVINAKDQFPLDTSVAVIFYAQDTGFKPIAKIVAELTLWVDHPMFVLEGGYQGWLEKGGPTAAEKIRTQIVYLPKPGPGEIVGDEFMNIVNGKPEDKLVLDVRTADETSAGKIIWAKHIPLDDLQVRLGELPKDKEIIVHCGTGIRAQMAYNLLQNAGLKSRFLNNNVAFIGQQPICCYKE